MRCFRGFIFFYLTSFALTANPLSAGGLPSSNQSVVKQVSTPSIVVDKHNGIVTCNSPANTTMGELIQRCDAAGDYHGFDKFDKNISVKTTLEQNENNIRELVLELKANVLSDPNRAMVLGAKTHKFDSGLKVSSLFCGLDDRFSFGEVTEVTFTLREKEINYPDFHLVSIANAMFNGGKVQHILCQIKRYLKSGRLPSRFEKSGPEWCPPKMDLFKNYLHKLKSGLEYQVFTRAGDSAVYKKDESVSTPSPDSELIVAFPRNTEEVAAIIKGAHRYSVPWIARGKGTSLTGSPIPLGASVVVDLSRYMTNIVAFKESPDGESAIVLAEPGAINKAVKDYVNERGWRFSPTPASYEFSTIGGNLANDSVGINGAKDGATGNFVNAATLVMPSGDILTLRRDNRQEGALLGLLAGSEGRLGIFTELEFALSKQISAEDMYTLLFKFADARSAINAVTKIHESGIVPFTLEFMDTHAVEAINYAAKNKIEIEYVGLIDQNRYYEGAGSVLLIRVTGSDEETAEIRRDKILAAVGKTYEGLVTAHGEDEAEKAADILETRTSLFLIVERTMKDLYDMDRHLDLDPVIPLSRAAEFYNKIKAATDIAFPVFCHAGDMIWHPLIFYNSKYRVSCVKALNAMKAIDDGAVALGGLVSGEHGIGVKLDYLLEKGLQESEIFFQRCVFAAFSNRRLANPDKIISKTVADNWLDSIFCKEKLSEYDKTNKWMR